MSTRFVDPQSCGCGCHLIAPRGPLGITSHCAVCRPELHAVAELTPHAEGYPCPVGPSCERLECVTDREELGAELEALYLEELERVADRAAEARYGGRACANWYASSISFYAAWRNRARYARDGSPVMLPPEGGHELAGWYFTSSAHYIARQAAGQREYVQILGDLDGQAEERMVGGFYSHGDPLPPIYAAGHAAILAGAPVWSYSY